MKTSIKDYIYLSVLWLFHSLLNIWFIFKDTTPPEWDPSIHGILSLLYFRGSDIVFTANYYPPFFHLSITLLYALFGTFFDVACCVNVIFLAILLFSIYGIGKNLFNREAGLISALFISFIPMLINLQRDLFIDFALISMISLSIFLLLKTQNFKNINYSILFGIVAGCTLLTKWTAIFFLIAPVVWVLYQSIKNSDFSKSVKCNVCGSVILFLLVTYSWYIPNYAVVSYLSKGQAYWGAAENDPVVFSLSSFFYYFNAVNVQVYLIFLIFALVGLLFLLLKADKNKRILFIFSLLVPYIIFTLTRNKDIRYTIPLLVFLVLIVGFMLASINNKKIRAGVICAFIIFGLVQTSTITFGVPSFDTINYIYPESKYPQQLDWKVNETLNMILNNSDASQQTEVLMLYAQQHMNPWTLRYYIFLYNIPILMNSSAVLDYEPEKINIVDFVLCSQRDLDKHEISKSVIDDFVLIGEVDVPNDPMMVYKRR